MKPEDGLAMTRWDMYQYVGSSPVVFVDPLGLKKRDREQLTKLYRCANRCRIKYKNQPSGGSSNKQLQDCEKACIAWVDGSRPDSPVANKPGGDDLEKQLDDMLQDMCTDENLCKTDTGDGKPCSVKQCKMEALRIAQAIINTWNKNYGNGPQTHPHACGGYYCWDWARGFDEAFNKINPKPKCFESSEKWKQQPRPSQIVHYWAEISPCGKPECGVAVDDGFVNGDYVHHLPFPFGYGSPWSVPSTWDPGIRRRPIIPIGNYY